MAHALRLSELTDELIERIANYDMIKNAKAFKSCKDSSTRALKSHRFGRTNQYAVRGSLNGLIEKFQILDNDSLAEALEECLERLDKKQYKWAPEVLSLLLNLSDRPHEKSAVENAISHPELDPVPTLTWDDIIADDPLETDGLWDDVDYRAGSSDDDVTTETLLVSEGTSNTTSSIPAENYNLFDINALILKPDATKLTNIINSQISVPISTEEIHTQRSQDRIIITEIQVIRDTLQMLTGLPSKVFTLQDTYVLSMKHYSIVNVSSIVFDDILDSLTEIGTSLSNLRKWRSMRQSIPLLQSFQAAASKRIHDFDNFTAHLQKQLVPSENPLVVSLLSIETRVRSRARMLMQLWEMVHSIHDRLRTRPFILLDTLFEQSSDMQAAADDEAFEFFARLLLNCLQTYLRPIRGWMQAGTLEPSNTHFPILLRDEGADSANFWRERYALRVVDGEIHAPKLLLSSLSEILASGKSAAFLKALGLENGLLNLLEIEEPSLAFENVHHGDANSLAPFTDSLQRVVQSWVASKHNFFTGILTKALLDKFDVIKTIDALELIYLSKDSAIFDAFCRSVFLRLDCHKSHWCSRPFLEGLVQTIFGNAKSIDLSAITVQSDKSTTSGVSSNRTVKALTAITLNYKYSWPLRNVIPTGSLKTYQMVFTLLLQLRRARYLLTQSRMLNMYSNLTHRNVPDAKLSVVKSSLSLSIHHRLLHVVTTLESHILNHTHASACSELRRKLSDAKDIDTMVAAHEYFMSSIQSKALLGSSLSSIQKALLSCLDLTVLFSQLHEQEVSPDRYEKSSHQVPLASSPALATGGQSGQSNDAEANAEKMASYKQMYKQLHQLTSLIISGLRTAGRMEGGEESWEILAERLEWGMFAT